MSKHFVLVAVLIVGLGSLAVLGGCAGGKEVTRTDVNQVFDLSGKWNETDSQQVSAALEQQIMSAAWLEDFRGEKGRKPVLIIGDVRNKTSEHIAVKTFIADLERSFINGGRAKVVASPEERDQIRAERADQQEFSSVETMKQWGREKGADFMFMGEINMIRDREGKDESRYYQVDCYLVDLEDNTKVWAGYEKIKKLIEN